MITYDRSIDNSTPLVASARLFKGPPGNPFLAPRGVWIGENRLIVADTGQNRVFIWNTLPRNEWEAPAVVLGQQEAAMTGRNTGGVSASSLQYPSGIWSDGKKLCVADAWNHRVLIWLTFPETNGQPADIVLGQPDFESNLPNVKGIGAPPDARSLYWPYGVYSDGIRLWIADTGNRRVLFYRNFPSASYIPADGVIGKPSFYERDYEPADPVWPYSVKVSPGGSLVISDTQYYRVLIWKHWESAFTARADVIIGQPDFESNGQNQYGLFPAQNTLHWNYDSFFYQNGLFVADTANSRLLWFREIPDKHNTGADDLIGHEGFGTGSENANTRLGTDRQLYWPFALSIHEHTMAVADTGNHRLVLYRLAT